MLFPFREAKSLAPPKSRILTLLSFISMILSGLISLWISPSLWIFPRDKTSGLIILRISSVGILPPFALRYCFRVCPSRYSMTMYAVWFSLKNSIIPTISGNPLNFAMVLASLINFSRPSSKKGRVLSVQEHTVQLFIPLILAATPCG